MPNFDFIKNRNKWYIFSGILMIASIVAVGVLGLRLGLDFTGGSLLEVTYETSAPSRENATEIISTVINESIVIQETGDSGLLIRMPAISEDTHQAVLKALRDSTDRNVEEDRFESFGPSLGQELQRKATYAIIAVLIAIILYVAYAFRKVSKPVPSWKFGTIAVIALIHDVILVLGVFAVLGAIYNTEVNSFFITALLTLLGFSVHDTIVTLDRVRENLILMKDRAFAEIVNASINATITRSINTSVTTLFTLLAIYFVGGTSIQDLSLALIVGIIVGTYSSIFLAAPLLVTLNRPKKA